MKNHIRRGIAILALLSMLKAGAAYTGLGKGKLEDGLNQARASFLVPNAEAGIFSSKDRLYEKLFDGGIKPPEGEYNEDKIKMWRMRYNGNDPVYDAMEQRFCEREGHKYVPRKDQLLDGWGRMKGRDLQLIHDCCKEEGVPFDLAVYLALGESHWNDVKSSAGAKGHWQFMPATARAYGLTVNKMKDERGDKKKSTKAALRLLRDLHKMTYYWDDQIPGKISDNDRWLWAAWAYNRRPNVVFEDFKRLKGDPANYAKTCTNSESAKYVNKLFGIKMAHRDLVHEESRLFNKIFGWGRDKVRHMRDKFSKKDSELDKKTRADNLYEEYLKKENKLDAKERLKSLEDIKDSYLDDLEAKRHTKEWTDSAIDVVEEQMAKIKQEHPEEFSPKRTYDGISTDMNIAKDGEAIITVTKDKKTWDAGTVPYRIRPGDCIDDIALRLSSDVNDRYAIKQLITDSNPEIRDINKIRINQTIKVPGQYIKVPHRKLGDLIKEWYVNQPKDDAISYVKYLNGKDPYRDKIRPGEVILVPIF